MLLLFCLLLLQDVFAKHAAVLTELGVNTNNGLVDLYDKIRGHPMQDTIEKDIQVGEDDGPCRTRVALTDLDPDLDL